MKVIENVSNKPFHHDLPTYNVSKGYDIVHKVLVFRNHFYLLNFTQKVKVNVIRITVSSLFTLLSELISNLYIKWCNPTFNKFKKIKIHFEIAQDVLLFLWYVQIRNKLKDNLILMQRWRIEFEWSLLKLKFGFESKPRKT